MPALHRYFLRLQWLPLLVIAGIVLLAVVNLSGLPMNKLATAARQGSHAVGELALVQEQGVVVVVPSDGITEVNANAAPTFTQYSLQVHLKDQSIRIEAGATQGKQTLQATRGILVLMPRKTRALDLVSEAQCYADMSHASNAEREWAAVRQCRSLKKQQGSILARKKPGTTSQEAEAYYWEQDKLVYAKNGINQVLTTQGELTGCEDRVQRWNALQELRAQLRNRGIAVEQYHIFMVDHFGTYQMAQAPSLSGATVNDEGLFIR